MSVPTFATPQDRANVEQLMQPALIRVIDNIRKQLDTSDWQGQYEENLVWPDGTTEQQKTMYADLQKGLHGVPTEEHDRVATAMSKLPQPSPLYTLRLTQADQPDQTIDVWATCYQVCTTANEDGLKADTKLKADTNLFNENGEVDWLLLDEKTKALVESIFQALPSQ